VREAALGLAISIKENYDEAHSFSSIALRRRE